MSGAGVVILRDSASPLVAKLRSALRLEGMAVVIGRAERNLFREHLFALNSRRHKAGGRNYYTQAGRSVTVQAIGPSLTVSINQPGFRQRYDGGDIAPKPPRQFLTVADPGMPGYGKRAAEFSDLHVGRALNPKTGRMQWALIRNASTALRYLKRKQPDGSIKLTIRPGEVRLSEPVFWLVRSVHQNPDHSVLPSEQDILGTANTAIETRLRHLGDAGTN